MYKITREQASEELNMSTRSIDRYIRSGKLRSKKEWKIVYIHQSDIEKLQWKNSHQEIIVKDKNIKKTSSWFEKKEIIPQSHNSHLDQVYYDLKNELKEKDFEIKKLNIEIGKMQEIVKNSISLIDYKKSHFLLEESKSGLTIELEQIKKELEKKEGEIKEERKLNYIMITVTCILFFIILWIWFIKI